ncbi:MAG: mannose-1-phosphate guanylyltransferase, partial [Methanomicrobiales archaeon HGW-Methanomicrobiales-5]
NLHFLVNTGLYVLEPAVLDLIGDDEKIDMTELFRRIELDKGKIGVYPHHGKWFDIGQWEEYRETLRFFEGNVMEWSI